MGGTGACQSRVGHLSGLFPTLYDAPPGTTITRPTVQDTERDKDSARMGSDGLIAERIDTKLPYIDDGYVDESAPDLMGGLKKLFGGDR